MYFSGDGYKELFRTPDGSSIYGYGLLSNTKALFAFQDPELAEAVAIIIVIDTTTGKTIFKKTIGGAGETSFDFSDISGRGVFNDSEGLHIVQFNEGKVTFHSISDIKDKYPYAPFWVDANTVGYAINKDEKQMFETIKVP